MTSTAVRGGTATDVTDAAETRTDAADIATDATDVAAGGFGVGHPVVDRDAWVAARRALLVREKAHTRERDALTAARMALPWVKVEADYRFDTPEGEKGLGELFAGRSQLIVYHFMLAPGWDAGCVGCSFLADHLDGPRVHLENHDVTLTAVSRAPLVEIEAYRRRMGWQFPWASSNGSDFNRDFGVSFSPEDLASGRIDYNYREIDAADGFEELPGLSAFYRDAAGTVFHTYSTYARGAEDLIGTFMILDRAPKGRNERGPDGRLEDVFRRHDEYGALPTGCCHSAD